MAAHNEALFPTPKLRAHRPRTSDALQAPPAERKMTFTLTSYRNVQDC
jgi:hypothetical protein